MVDIIYELPEDPEKVAQVIGAVPSEWSWIDGCLLAPTSAYRDGTVAEGTRLVISRYYGTEPTIIWANDAPCEEDSPRRARRQGGRIPNLTAVFVEGKKVSSVAFREAAYESAEISMGMAKRILQGFIKQGYEGWAHIYSGCKNNSKYDNPEGLHIGHSNPGKIILTWNEEHGGKRENLQGIVETCERVGLRELEPAKES